MADNRTFTLIGEFKDGITPELDKINKSIDALKRNLGGFGSRKGGFNDLTQSMGKVIGAHIKLSEEVKTLRSELTKSIPILREYRKEMGKTVGANMAFQGKGQKFSSKNNPTLQFLDAATRKTRQLARASQGIRIGGGTPRGGGGGGGGVRPPRPSGGGGGYGGGGGGGMGAHMGEFGFAYTLGSSISQPIQNAIVSGFQIGVGFMVKPFEYFAKNLQERIQDEQSDIKSAGGIFSIARRQKDPFVKTMDEAMEFTQTNNKRMAELADSLPGNTQQYIEVSKRLSDSISRIVMADPTKAIQYSNKLREEEGKGAMEGNKQAQTKEAITQLLGEMTKKTVLAGLGTGGGPGGVAGAYGLPQLSERMLTQQSVSMGQFQKYAAIFKDPLIMDALNRFIPKINASAAGTMERFEVMQKFYDEVVPKEMIRKFERSTAGVLELFNTTIFGPETGLFGLGRKMEGMGVVMDDYGNYIKVFKDGTRKVVGSLAEASDANLSLFDMLRDSFANLGIALYPVLQNLGSIFDPINKIAKLLVDFRHATGRFLFAFESYKKGFEDMIKGMEPAKKKEFLKIGLDLRASLAAVNNFFANSGIIDEKQFQKNAKQLMSTSFDSKAMMSGMLDTFLNSRVASDLGIMIGQIVGTVLVEVAKVTGFLSGRIASSNKLFAGLKKGFDAAKGTKAFKNIFKDVFTAMFDVLKQLIQIIPIEAYFLAGMAVLAPAMVQGLAMSFASRVWTGIQGFLTRAGASVTASLGRQAAASSLGMNAAYLAGGGAAAGAAAPGAAAAGGGLLRVAGAIGAVVTALVLFEGGLENSTRQLNQGLGSSANSLGGIFDSLGVVIARVTGQEVKAGQDLSGNFDLIGAAMLPVTATFDLLEMSFRLLIEGFDNAALAVTKFGHWLVTSTPLKYTSSKEDQDFFAKAVKDLEARLAGSTAARNEARRQDDINYTSIRYNGREGYGQKVAQDIQSKQAKLSTLTKGSEEYTKINNDLFALKKLLVAITGSSPTAPKPGTPGATTVPKPGVPGAATVPVAVPPNSPAAAAITNTSAQTAQINQKASVQVSKLTQTNVTLATIKSVMGTLGGKLDAIAAAIRAGNMSVITAINSAASSGGFGGMGGGGIFNLPTGDGVGKVVRAGKMLQGMGLNVAENPYFGTGKVGGHAPGSYHYAGRAIDVTGPPAALDAAYAKLKGTSPAELLWRTAGHFDHLHVAYALGAGMPAFFGSQRAAMNWEKSMVPSSVKVGSVTSNSSEGFGGGPITINAPITIHQQPGQDSDELASIVAMKLGEAVAQARSASVFV